MQKRFPPEMMTFSQTPAGHDVKLSRSYCVYQNPDRKSISLKRCEPVPLRLISPFGAAMPKKGAAK
jgi:hypothetical protein